MKQSKGQYSFIAGSLVFMLMLNLLLLTVPTTFESYTGVNTSQLQDSTNITADVNENQTSETNVVQQAGDLVSIYTNFQSENLILSAIGTIFVVLLIVTLIDLIWIG